MADFCSLCGYGDIDIEQLYEDHIRHTTTPETIESMEDGWFVSVNVGGVCESCGLVSIGVNNTFTVWGGYYGSDARIIGHINKETMELVIDVSEDPFYIEQQRWMDEDMKAMLKEQLEWYNTPEDEFLIKYGFPKGIVNRPSDEELEKYGLL